MDNHELCDAYHFVRKEIPAHDGAGRIIMSGYGVCYGTKEYNQCYCGGDTDKCDFYPEKRKESKKTMKTAEMWNKAQVDGKTYVSKNAAAIYSKKFGLLNEYYLSPIGLGSFPNIEALMDCDWKEQEEGNIMTKTEAEEKFGIKIVG